MCQHACRGLWDWTETDRQTERETDRQTDRQAGRQAGRQADRQTGCFYDFTVTVNGLKKKLSAAVRL